MARRTVLLVSALVVAAIGTLLVFLYVRGVDDRAVSAQEPVTVLRAVQEIPTGTSVDEAAADGSFEQVTYPRGSIPAGAVSSTSALGDTIAARNILPNEIILQTSFTEPGEANERPTNAIPEGKIGVAVELADPNRVATFLEPGSRVVVFAADQRGARVLLPDVEVLAIGDAADSAVVAGEALPRELVTLAVDTQQALDLVAAANSGELWLGLLGQNTQVPPGQSAGGDAQ